MHLWMRRLSRLALVPVTLAMSLGTMSGVANADSQRNNPGGEVAAYYVHFLHRNPDPGGLYHYMPRVTEDCRWGLYQAAYTIGTSGESFDKNQSDGAKADALYRALLNRNPDTGGRTTYMNTIHARGLWSSIMGMMASDEYHRRLDRICAGRTNSNVNAVRPERAAKLAVDISKIATNNTALACGAAQLGTLVTRIQRVPPSLAGKAIKIALDRARSLASKGKQACRATYQILLAADETAKLASWEGQNNPVFLGLHQWKTPRKGLRPAMCNYTYWLGSEPQEYATYKWQFVC